MSSRLLALLGTLLVLGACKEPAPDPAARAPEARRYFGAAPDGKLRVYFFDVGQGDAALIVAPNGTTVLVDSGPESASRHLVNRLPELLTKPLDLVVLTHPHVDHHGALDAVLRRVGARQLMEPQLPTAPPDYDALLTKLGERRVQVVSPAPPTSTPNAPQRINLGDGVSLTILWPRAPSEPLLDAPSAALEVNSIVMRLSYGETSVLFTGDALAQTEEYLLAREVPVQSTLLKVGAHGLDTATTAAFLTRVGARAAVISVGAGNAFKAPAPATLERLKAAHLEVFRTDEHGEVQVVSDGKSLVISPQRLKQGTPSDMRYTLVGQGPTPLPDFWAGKPLFEKKPVVEAAPVEPVKATEAPAAPPKEERNNKKYKGPYHASRKRDKFHIPDCDGARKIHAENLIIYKTREEAIRERRPAQDCNP
ncbi:ComEC/Rec2 family competence protein [Myxococcus sp. AS-1-15]|uniref:ComEC/Rec2 family competence protein n=1 Tax=Myxococcus sp. AS-1-15 TaxID=2874600 RepID=UPI001CC09462|nr:MBL fold metallo-hydrolase [Myxococcus sp. AS-1-15]MBZ4394669.1 MBL fold metallo-hydrolase [Myxococcus sp. AS-1-15]